MGSFIELFFRFWQSLYDLLNSVTVSIGGIQVSYGVLIISFLAIAMVISVFWKGGQA